MRREVNRSTQVTGNRHVLLAKGCTTLVKRKVQHNGNYPATTKISLQSLTVGYKMGALMFFVPVWVS